MTWSFVRSSCGSRLGLASIVAVAVVAASCSINHRSGQFDCQTTADCAPGRTCADGLCVTGGALDAPGDGPKQDAPPLPDASVCPAACTSCADGKICIIDCAAGANCGSRIACPPGFHCTIRCNQMDACRAGISCAGAASCDIQCTGRRSCRNVMCGAGPCKVGCSAPESCQGITCGSSCACDVTCGFANGSCSNVQCTALLCDTGLGCTSSRPGCNTCP